MALFQPSNITPSDLSGTGTIDATQGMSVTWQVNGSGNTPMTAFQITIMNNDTTSAVLYTTGQVSLSEPFYGSDPMGNPQYFTADIAAEALSAAGIVNGAENGYKFTITQWWTSADSVAQTSASVFITRSAPQIEITNFSPTIAQMNYTFNGAYTQAQGDPLEWARWQISSAGGKETLLDTGRIYNVGQLTTNYDGFISGNSYMIRLSGQTISGVGFDTGWQVFTASYEQTEFDGYATVCQRCDTDAVQVNFPSPLYTYASGSGDWSIEPSSDGSHILILPSAGDSVTWQDADRGQLSLTAPFSIAWKGSIAQAGPDITVLSVSMDQNVFNLIISSGSITGNTATVQLFNLPYDIAQGDQLVVGVTPGSWFVRVGSDGGDWIEEGGETGNWQSNINGITLNGPQNCRYVWAVDGVFTEAQMAETTENSPAYDETTQFLAVFDAGLSGGAIRSASPVKSLLVYRNTVGSGTYRKCATLDVGSTSFRDYSAVNGKQYRYYLYGQTEDNESTSVISSGIVSPSIWNYTVLLCSQDANGDYHVQEEYRFALDVSSGTGNNNNKPVLQSNFTPYPLRQPSSQNYRSSTLTSYIGKAVNGQYVDSLSQIDALRQISTSTLAKFLKTRKGELIRIETSDPVTMTVGDKYARQPVRVGLPWVEVGSAEDANILTAPTDAYWTAE